MTNPKAQEEKRAEIHARAHKIAELLDEYKIPVSMLNAIFWIRIHEILGDE